MADRMSIPRSERGMTLIEVLVAGVISTIVAGAIFVVWKSFSDQIKASSTAGTLQMQYSEAVGQIGRYARQAHRIVEDSLATANDGCRADSCASTNSLFFYDRDGNIFAAIYLVGDTLYEYDSTGATGPFTTGSGAVLVDTCTFAANGCRNAMLVDMTLKRPDGDTIELFTAGTEIFRCRN